jgi:hypothetical protein
MEPINKPINKLVQFFTAVGAITTIWAAQTMTFAISHGGNPAQAGAEAARPDGVPADLVGPTGTLTDITNKILYAVGIVSVIMLIYGGFRYIISGGDKAKVTDAKNTILYAIIGLIISILAFAIVKFILGALGASSIIE